MACSTQDCCSCWWASAARPVTLFLQCLPRSALATQPPLVCLQHPHILQLLEVFLTDEFLAISTQYAAGGDLAEFVAARCQRDSVTALPEAQARYLFQQLIIAVDFCHQVGVLIASGVCGLQLLCTKCWQDACCCEWGQSSRPLCSCKHLLGVAQSRRNAPGQ